MATSTGTLFEASRPAYDCPNDIDIAIAAVQAVDEPICERDANLPFSLVVDYAPPIPMLRMTGEGPLVVAAMLVFLLGRQCDVEDTIRESARPLAGFRERLEARRQAVNEVIGQAVSQMMLQPEFFPDIVELQGYAPPSQAWKAWEIVPVETTIQ